MKILVCGGAGYIGSHAVMELLDGGYEVVVADSLEVGHKKAVHKDAELIVGDFRDKAFCCKLFSEGKIDAVINFAAYTKVAESVANPVMYFENNSGGMINLLSAMQKKDCRIMVFSSTASVYGEPDSVPVYETAPTNPMNPYGESKLMCEKILSRQFAAVDGFAYAAMRYFNVAGAHESGAIGEDHRPESHIVPLAIHAALSGKILDIYGNDYETPDGTCIRDYIHVQDLAYAHVLALKSLINEGGERIYNMGSSKGFSVLEIIEAVEKATGKPVHRHVNSRRPGDPARLIASSEKISKELGFKPRLGTLEQIMETALKWHSTHPNGYKI